MGEQLNDSHSDKSKSNAGYLFFLGFVMIVSSSSLYFRAEFLGLASVAVGAATAVMVLMSAGFSFFGATRRAKVVLGFGVVGLIVWVVLIAVRTIEYISEHS